MGRLQWTVATSHPSLHVAWSCMRPFQLGRLPCLQWSLRVHVGQPSKRGNQALQTSLSTLHELRPQTAFFQAAVKAS